MVYITGDLHGELDKFYDNKRTRPQPKAGDYLIICGDFGVIWHSHEDARERMLLDWFNEQPYITLFVDGNHENHERLAEFPVEEWKGGNVHKISDKVIHLMRGQVFTIEGKKFFTFGGAQSHDISDGILEYDKNLYDNIQKLERAGKYMYRINRLSWWAGELPSDVEMDTGKMNLFRNNWKVDYVITHCLPTNKQAEISGGLYKSDKLTDYLQELADKLKFDKWFCGHYHIDYTSDKTHILYDTFELVKTEVGNENV